MTSSPFSSPESTSSTITSGKSALVNEPPWIRSDPETIFPSAFKSASAANKATAIGGDSNGTTTAITSTSLAATLEYTADGIVSAIAVLEPNMYTIIDVYPSSGVPVPSMRHDTTPSPPSSVVYYFPFSAKFHPAGQTPSNVINQDKASAPTSNVCWGVIQKAMRTSPFAVVGFKFVAADAPGK